MDQKLAMLSKVPMFAGCTPRDLTEVGRLAEEVTVPAGKVIAREGSSGHEFFVIAEGNVEITRGGERVRTLGPGDHFGELAMLGNVPRTATATATTPTTLFVLGHREFATLLADHPETREQVLRSVALWISEIAPGKTT
jgi:CRP/FNR family transcriptional regulator, cyclic AMP receptor protein